MGYFDGTPAAGWEARDRALLDGRGDQTGKVGDYSIRWAEEEKCELVVLPDAAHSADTDNPAGLNEALERFIQPSSKVTADIPEE